MSNQEGKFVRVTVIAPFHVEIRIEDRDTVDDLRERAKKFAEYDTISPCPECGEAVVGVLSCEMIIQDCLDMPELVE